jgi:hypothetical protein
MKKMQKKSVCEKCHHAYYCNAHVLRYINHLETENRKLKYAHKMLQDIKKLFKKCYGKPLLDRSIKD